MKIIRTALYRKDLKRLGLTEAEAAKIEAEIAANPEVGDVMRGLDGLRKVRFAFGGRGKRGGGRSIYFLMMSDGLAAMMFAYAKNEQADLTPAQRKVALKLMKEIRDG